jgi:hypothetical protein
MAIDERLYINEMIKMTKKYNYPPKFFGIKYGRIYCMAEKKEDGIRWVYGKCDCGTYKWFRVTDLIRGRTRSCGCYNRYASRKRASENNPMRDPAVAVKRSGDNNPTKRPEVRAKMSESARARAASGEWANPMTSPEVRAKVAAKISGDNNPSKRAEVRAKISASIKALVANGDYINRMMNPETRAKLSATKKCKFASGELKPSHGNKSIYIKKDGTDVELDSSYEVGVARRADSVGLEWMREPKFQVIYGWQGQMKTGMIFPDFLFPTLENKAKWNAFVEQYGKEYSIFLRTKKDLQKMCILDAQGYLAEAV